MVAGTWQRGGREIPATLPRAGVGLACAVLPALLVVALAIDAGGYYARSWAPAMLGCAAVAAGALLATRRVPLQRRDALGVGLFAAWLAWVGAETLRAGAATAGMPVVERGALYVAILATALLVLRPGMLEWLLVGLLAGLVVVAAIGLEGYLTAVTPNAFEGRTLFAPVGYANAAGILCAVGCLLAIGLAVHGSRRGVRVAAAAALVALLEATAATQSRGSLAALVAGVVTLVALGDRRGRAVSTLVVALPLPLVAVLVSSRTHLGDAQATANSVQQDGRAVGALLVVLTIAAAGVGWATLADGGIARRDLRLGRRTALLVCLVAVPLAVAAAAARGASLLLGDRVAYWAAAVRDVAANPLLGSGPGSFASAWLRYRDVSRATLDAHNLYLQTLAELGPIGLALLVLALAFPLVVALRSRARSPHVATIAAAYVALLLHSAVDWDWQMPAVAATAVVLAAALLVSTRDERDPDPARPAPVAFAVAAVAAVVTAVAAVAVAAGNQALASAEHAAARGDWGAARAYAREAAVRQPWSSEPLLVLGQASAETGDARAAHDAFGAAARRDPANWRAWYDLALASRGVERETALIRLRRLDPLGTR